MPRSISPCGATAFEREVEARWEKPHPADAIGDAELERLIVATMRETRNVDRFDEHAPDELYAICERTGRLALWERCMDRVQPRDEFGSREARKGPSPRATPFPVYELYGTYRWGGR